MLNRFLKSAVIWSWGFNTLRLATGLILLPLVLRKLSTPDYGMYFVLLFQVRFVPVIDFGFGPTIGRFVSYAYGGAQTLQALGVEKSTDAGKPNYVLLWQLLDTTRRLYRYLTLVLLVILGIWGTFQVELSVHETSSVLITRLAWATTLAAALLDIYWSWWNTYLNGMNQVLIAARIGTLAMVVRLTLSVLLLLSGAGLLSLPIAGLFASLLERQLARRQCLKLLPGKPTENPQMFGEIMRILWPNTWRLGIQFLSFYLITSANTSIIQMSKNKFAQGLVDIARYGLSTTLMGIAGSMAAVWTQTKWPLIGQFQARHEYARLRQVLWPRIWLQSLTFFALAGGVVFLGPMLLQWFGHGKEMLPRTWLLVLVVVTFLDMQFSLWTTLLSTGNQLPQLWYTVATNVLSFTLSLALVQFTSLGLGAFVLGPLLAGCLFNYWHWPFFAARSIGTTLFRFLFFGPGKPDSESAAPPVTPA